MDSLTSCPASRYAPILAVLILAQAVAGQQVSGRVTVLDRDARGARDVADAVVWLERARPAAADPETLVVNTQDKEFRPRVAVVRAGDAISFPNQDAFNHNVFSSEPHATFDLGLYGRRQTRVQEFPLPGVVRIYCNVHAEMSAVVVVVPEALFARPGADGSFGIDRVPPGRYTLKAWHERAAQVAEQEVTVPAAGASGLTITLDARGFQRVQHLNKFGQPYRATGRRY